MEVLLFSYLVTIILDFFNTNTGASVKILELSIENTADCGYMDYHFFCALVFSLHQLHVEHLNIVCVYVCLIWYLVGAIFTC